MPKKIRIPISKDSASEIMVLSDRTCCVCNERGKFVQIHHIDENPANNSFDNLSVLCLECHNETMIKGGFGRKLDATQIIKYQSIWLERVKKRREKADDLASIKAVTGKSETTLEEINKVIDFEQNDYEDSAGNKIIKSYLNNILIIHKAQLIIAQTKWDTGITSKMNQGSYDMVAFYEEVLVELSTFYPENHFNKKNPKEYFSELISSRFSWHRLVLEPKGIGNGGTMVSTITGGRVMDDLKQMIVEIVNSLMDELIFLGKFDIQKWESKWLI